MVEDWRDSSIDDLCDALLVLRTRDEAAAFLRDICSLHELESLSHRWQAARMVHAGTPYARVASQLHHGEGGYRLVLERLGARR
jgi:TrpR-related protein YerC/YecD